MTGRASRWLALAGLVILAVMVASPVSAASLAFASPLLALALAGLLGWRRWPIATAVAMLPYFSYGMMATITDAAGRGRAMIFALLTVIVLLAAFDSSRRQR